MQLVKNNSNLKGYVIQKRKGKIWKDNKKFLRKKQADDFLRNKEATRFRLKPTAG